MKGVRLKAFGLALLGSLALLFAGCGQQGGGSTPQATKGSLTVNVTPGDAQVQVTGPNGYNQSFAGGRTLTNLDPGDYTVQASKAGYFTASATHAVEAGKTTTVNLNLLPVPAAGPTEGKVAVLVVNGNGAPIAGAAVSDGTNSATTDAQGRADLTYTSAGVRVISVNASGYLGDAQLASVELGKTVALTFKLQPVPTPAPTTGTLVVHVYGEDTGQTLAGASVTSNPSLTFSPSGSVFTATAAPGTYAVTASAPGYLSGSRAVNVEAGKTAVLNLGLRKNTASGPVGEIRIVSVKDQWGVDLPKQREVNEAKNVDLYASQSEEPVCVTVQVTNGGQPVAGARVRVTAVSETFDYTVEAALYPGCERQTTELDFVTTDANGEAKFSFQGIFRGIADSFTLSSYGPIKFLVSASEQGSGWTARSKEFKVFFYNITHLYFAHAAGNRVDSSERPRDQQMAPKRTGHDFGTILNYYNDNRNQMAHTFWSYVRRKQPTSNLIPPLYGDISYYEMVYTLEGGDVNDVQWVAGCDAGSTATTCVDSDGSGVALNLKPTVRLQDLPKEVRVRATMRVEVRYGDSEYSFDLKDYTFTKRWVGAFLTVEKYVDNHVLTWYGPDRTLPASSDRITGGIPDEYTSTVHVVVRNPSQSTLYNVTIRDALPPELGVVTDSISDNGTYDPVNHVITWDFSNFTALQQVDPGEENRVSFKVYVRQKPGFCANPSLVRSTYVVPALYGSAGIASGENRNNCNRPYDDPYKVVNGLAVNDVTASGYLTPDLRNQLVFDYTPVADESDIWAVRPIFNITKTLLSSSPITQGASALFEISVTHVDRTASENAYRDLKTKYPWEFGNDTLGTGHRSPTYSLRYNTYARDVKVDDIFEDGLDFNDASNFTGAGLLSGGQAQAYNPVVGKRFGWTAMDIRAGSTVTAQIALVGNLLTPDPNNQENTRWDNCALLGAPQLNQPAEVAGTAYTNRPVYVPGIRVWNKDQFPLNAVSDLSPEATDDVFTATVNLEGLQGKQFIASCAGVEVEEPPPSPFLSLTSNGEYNGSDPFTNPTGQPGVGANVPNTGSNPGNTLVDGIPVGTTFWYKGTIFNTGGANAQNVTFTATLTGTPYVNFVTSSTNTRLYVVNNVGTVINVVSPTTITSTQVTFSIPNIPAGGYARVVLEARGIAVGQQRYMELRVASYDGSTQLLPLITQETTTIIP